MEAPKATEVASVQKYRTSYGKEVPAVIGMLALIETTRNPVRNCLCKTYYKDGSSGYHIADNRDLLITEYSNVDHSNLVNPIIVSDEPVMFHDKALLRGKYIVDVLEIAPHGIRYSEGKDLTMVSWCNEVELKKIIVLPDQFTNNQLIAITTQKIKDGDKVLVECEEFYYHFCYSCNKTFQTNEKHPEKHCGELGVCNNSANPYFQIKFNESKFITLHKSNKKEDLRRFCERYHDIRVMQSATTAEAWFNENVTKFLTVFLFPILLLLDFKTVEAQNGHRAIDSLSSCLKTAKSPLAKAYLYNDMRREYVDLGNYPQALNSAFNALSLFEKEKSDSNIFIMEGNIAAIYSLQGEEMTALQYLNKASKYKINDDFICYMYSVIYNNLGKYDSSLYYAKIGLQNSTDKIRICSLMNTIGTIYEHSNLDSALLWYNKSLTINTEIENASGISECLGSIGDVFYKKKNFEKALEYEYKSLDVSTHNGLLDHSRETYRKLSEIYTDLHDCKRSYENFRKYIILRDSLINENRIKQIVRTEEGFKFQKEKELAKAEQDKKDAIEAQRFQNQRNLRNIFIAGFAIVGVLAAFIFRSYRKTKKQKLVIEEQKKIVEDSKKQLTDNINYAKGIQKAILPSDEYLKKNLPEHFLIYRPKDIVSGDFYWCYTDYENEITYFATADATGHGASASMLTMLGSQLLNEIVIHRGITQPDLVLNALRDEIINSLNKEEASYQGIDLH